MFLLFKKLILNAKVIIISITINIDNIFCLLLVLCYKLILPHRNLASLGSMLLW